MSFMSMENLLNQLQSEFKSARSEAFAVAHENDVLRHEVSDLKTEIGRLEALLADKKPESECECDYDCECCKCRDEAEDESEPTLKDLYKLGKYLVDTVDEIESIHIQVVRTRKKEDDDEE